MTARHRLALALCALGSSGCLHAHTGPLLGYSPAQGVALGWEGGAGIGPFSANLGTEVRPFGDPVMEVYAAGEPALAVPLGYDPNPPSYPDLSLSAGGTAALTLDNHGQSGAMAGGFVGAPWVLSGGDCRDRAVTTLSISIGVHVFIDDDAKPWTVYATPKLGTLVACPDLRYSGSFRQ